MSTMTEDITTWAAEHGVRVEIERDKGTQVRDGWEHHAYVVTLHVGDRSHAGIEWHQGLGIDRSPEDSPADVLDALVSDATAYLNAQNFEDYAAEFGLDSDSRKAEATFLACAEVAEWLPELVGGQEAFDHLAYKVERL